MHNKKTWDWFRVFEALNPGFFNVLYSANQN